MRPIQKILFVSHTPEGGTYKVGSHHLARELSRSGAHVVHASAPQSIMHELLGVNTLRSSLSKAGSLVDDHQVTHVVPRTVLPMQLGGVSAFYRQLEKLTGGGFDVLLLDEPLLISSSAFKLAARLIYRPTDVYARGLRARRQKRAVRLADSIVATSNDVLRLLPAHAPKPTSVVYNGVEFSRFGPLTTEHRDGVVYVGSLDRRFDWELLAAVAHLHTGQRFHIYGPASNVPREIPSNVSIRGTLPYNAVPGVLSNYKVGLMPFVQNQLNGGRSPMKLYEYLAAGLHVLRPSFEGQETPPGVKNYVDADNAAAILDELLRSPYPNEEGRCEASQEDWSIKARQIEVML